MPIELDIAYADSLADTPLPDPAQLQGWAQHAYRGEADVYVALRVVDKAESQQLNRDYRQQDKPTNVLSFPMQMAAEITRPILGDLAICAAVVAEEAAAQGKPLDAHWAHMLIHGLLHLQGYDHIADAEAEKMEALEREILAELGYPDPYHQPLTDL